MVKNVTTKWCCHSLTASFRDCCHMRTEWLPGNVMTCTDLAVKEAYKQRAECIILHYVNAILMHSNLILCVAVPCRNWRLFRRVFTLHHRVWSVVLLTFRYRCSHIYEPCVSPAFSGSSAVRCFKWSNAIKIDGITFDFYTGLSHITHVNLQGNDPV